MKMKNNVLGLRGRIGNLVFKKYRYGTVVTPVPDMSRAGCSAQQRTQRDRFREAARLAREALGNPAEKQRFDSLPGNGSAWNKAVQYFMRQQK
jgi:hypothetical protein